VTDTVLAGRYRLDAELGSGGMATVYRATDLRLRRPVAVKLLFHAGDDAAARLRREARVAALLESPGLCRIFDLGHHGGALFLTMDLLAGETVHAHERAKAPDLGRSLRWVTAAAKTMSLVHDHGIVHRDLKPENLFLDRRGGAETLIVLDFGLAFVAGTDDPELGRLTGPDQTAGTPTYMAPELLTGGEIGPAVDVYALGCVLYELLAGAPPFVGDRMQVLGRHLAAAPLPVRDSAPWVPAELELLVDAMLAKQPGDRPTMREVADLASSIAARHDGRTLDARRERRINRMVTMAPPLRRGAMVPGAPIGRVRLLGDADPELVVALVVNDLQIAEADDPDPDVVLALGPLDDAGLRELVAQGISVVATAPAGDFDLAIALARAGVADVLTTPIVGDVAARKLLRVMRDRARRKR